MTAAGLSEKNIRLIRTYERDGDIQHVQVQGIAKIKYMWQFPKKSIKNRINCANERKLTASSYFVHK